MKLAWVTGGGTGIGRALAQALSKRGCRVVISGRRVEVLQETARQIESRTKGGEILPLACDVTVPASVERTASIIRDRWGIPDLLINNAGRNSHTSVMETFVEEYQKMWEVNCLSAILCSRAVIPGMQERGSGAIVNISSILGKWGSCTSAGYSVGKYAVTGFTDILRQELAGSGIHVMGVYPGFIKTALTEQFIKPGSPKAWFGKSPDAMARVILRGLRWKCAEVHYPWYVSWFLRFHRWFPGTADRLAHRVRH